MTVQQIICREDARAVYSSIIPPPGGGKESKGREMGKKIKEKGREGRGK